MKHFEISHLEICRTFVINQLFIYQLIFSRFNMRGYVFVYSILYYISFLKKEKKRTEASILYFLVNVRKKTCWKRTNLSKHHRLNLAKCFFFSSSLFEINFSNILIAFCSELTIDTYMYIYNAKIQIQINRISNQMKEEYR